MTQLMWPWHAMIKAHKVILSAHSVWINNLGECLYQSKKEILEPSGKVWYPTRKKYFGGTTLRRKGVQVHLWCVRSMRRRLRFAKEWEREGGAGGAGGEHVGVDGGSTGDHDKQTEETLLADNADVEEESLEKLMGTNLFWDQKKQNSEIWISLLISFQ